MSHPRAFEEWEGQLVKLNESDTEVAVLREVTEWRIVLHYSKLIRLPRQQTEYSVFGVLGGSNVCPPRPVMRARWTRITLRSRSKSDQSNPPSSPILAPVVKSKT